MQDGRRLPECIRGEVEAEDRCRQIEHMHAGVVRTGRIEHRYVCIDSVTEPKGQPSANERPQGGVVHPPIREVGAAKGSSLERCTSMELFTSRLQGIGEVHRHGGRLPQNLNDAKRLSTGEAWMT